MKAKVFIFATLSLLMITLWVVNAIVFSMWIWVDTLPSNNTQNWIVFLATSIPIWRMIWEGVESATDWLLDRNS